MSLLDESQGTDRNRGLNKDTMSRFVQRKVEEVIDVEAAYDSKSEDGREELNNYDYLGLHGNRVLSSTLNPTIKNSSSNIIKKPKATTLKVRISLVLISIYYTIIVQYKISY